MQAIEYNTSYGVTEETQAKCWGDRGGGGGAESALGAPKADFRAKACRLQWEPPATCGK